MYVAWTNPLLEYRTRSRQLVRPLCSLPDENPYEQQDAQRPNNRTHTRVRLESRQELTEHVAKRGFRHVLCASEAAPVKQTYPERLPGSNRDAVNSHERVRVRDPENKAGALREV